MMGGPRQEKSSRLFDSIEFDAMISLPSFNIFGYAQLIQDLMGIGCNFRSINQINAPLPKDVFLRHDVDFSLELALPMAEAEHALNIRSCYYVLLSGPYNPCSSASINAMKRLREMGHEIGLHYDLAHYPDDLVLARKRLDSEVAFLQELSGGEVTTIVMHEPSRGHQDFFHDAPSYVNPTYFQRTNHDLLYISDSCRAWRDMSLCEYLSGQSEKSCLMLNTHPEVWLADRYQHRITYLEKTLMPKVLAPTQRFFLEYVREAWETHIGPVHGYGDSDE